MKTTLDVDLLPKLERLTAVLSAYDPVTQQKLLELASARHAMRAGNSSGIVTAGMHKHINQILKQKETNDPHIYRDRRHTRHTFQRSGFHATTSYRTNR